MECVPKNLPCAPNLHEVLFGNPFFFAKTLKFLNFEIRFSCTILLSGITYMRCHPFYRVARDIKNMIFLLWKFIWCTALFVEITYRKCYSFIERLISPRVIFARPQHKSTRASYWILVLGFSFWGVFLRGFGLRSLLLGFWFKVFIAR